MTSFTHSWENYFVAKALFICRCGVHFHTHQQLLDHTAELNEPKDTRSMGSVGAAIEYTAHKETVGKLDRAVRLLQLLADDDSTHYELAEEIQEFLKEIGCATQ